jgi:Tfp pilus assembly protein PilE
MQYIYIMIVIGGLAGGAYTWYTDTMERYEVLAAEKAALNLQHQQQEAAFEALKKSHEQQRVANDALTRRNSEIESEAKSYLEVFKKHDLTKLARAKPGLIETKANNATDKIFKVIEDETEPQDYDPTPNTNTIN